ncbi:chemokine-like factor isoform X2 [Monodelphis domestica]|uniref:chemokine-like factor isoform X2 n=1 Tax=Monodelphis domestica TaxID=13616 RepID=UPI00044339EC|nr:chemokine-like factor isoform X2 [Monodelphis domestica]
MEATISALKWSKMTKMRMREEGRLKVQPKITRTAFGYLYSVSGILKVLRMLFVFGASIAFIIASVHESYIAILLLESCIVLSFIIIYMLGLHHLLVFILWPAFDILNCILTAGFLVVVGFLVLWEEGTDKYVLGGAICCFIAAVVCILEIAFQGEHTWPRIFGKRIHQKMVPGREKSNMNKKEKGNQVEKQMAPETRSSVTPTRIAESGESAAE